MGVIRSFLFGPSLTSTIVALVLAAWGGLMINNAIQRDRGGDQREAKIIKRSNEVAKERDESAKKRATKVRRKYRGNAAFDELRRKYGASD